MKGFQIVPSRQGVVIRDAVSLKAETTFASLHEALVHLERLVAEHGAIDVQIDGQTWLPG